MFRPGGVWREFGLSSSEHHTLFPFWMFAIVWAFFSYALATICLSMTVGSSEPSGFEITSDPIIQSVSNVQPAPISSAPTEPGYYILKPSTIESSGANYVYYGPTPPPPHMIESLVEQRR
jgi:hypothetical protein